MSAPITFAKVKGPPANWHQLEVFDGDRLLDSVVEADTVAGYVLQHYRDDDGHWVNDGERMLTRRVESKNLTIRVRE